MLRMCMDEMEYSISIMVRYLLEIRLSCPICYVWHAPIKSSEQKSQKQLNLDAKMTVKLTNA